MKNTPKDEIRSSINKLLISYRQHAGTDLRGAIRDALTELMFIAEENQLDFDRLVDGANEVYREEQLERDLSDALD